MALVECAGLCCAPCGVSRGVSATYCTPEDRCRKAFFFVVRQEPTEFPTTCEVEYQLPKNKLETGKRWQYTPLRTLGAGALCNDPEKDRRGRSVARHTRHAHPENSDPRRNARLRHRGIHP